MVAGARKQTERTVNRAREYAQEALARLVEAGVASSIDVQAQTVRMGVLGLFVQINPRRANPQSACVLMFCGNNCAKCPHTPHIKALVDRVAADINARLPGADARFYVF